MSDIQRPRMLNEKRESGWSTAVLFVFVCLVAVFLIVDVWLNTAFFGVAVSGDSMLNTVQDGDFLYAKRDETAERGDIVIIDVHNYKDRDHLSGDYIIKRLIATEGETVYCENGTVYVCKTDGTTITLDEPYAVGKTGDFDEVTVGAGQIFFLGDNRAVSADSRKLGCYQTTDIAGVVPDWAVSAKEITTGWEEFRAFFARLFTNTQEE